MSPQTRLPLIAGNWKMHKTIAEAVAFVEEFVRLAPSGPEIVLCPPFTALYAVQQELADRGIGLGAQDLFWESKGAFTGEVAPGMLREAGCDYCIVGHSERRQYFGETDETVNRKVKAALAAGIKPIICVGESLAQREAGETAAWVESQVRGALGGLSAGEAGSIVIAYEPIWAIGTGRNASATDAQEVCRLIRATVRDLFGDSVAQGLRIQYGGSVKPENAAEFMREPDIDGALVGGASLEPAGLAKIAEGAR